MKVFNCSVIFLFAVYTTICTGSSIIIVEDAKACFRRVFAGKRITRGLVRRALSCETVQDCQRECADEKRFTCEGFNYRLDPTGRGKGECELVDLPMSRLDTRRDCVVDPDYDYYERDRNAAIENCRQHAYSDRGNEIGGYRGHYGGGYGESGGNYGGSGWNYGGSGGGYGGNQGIYGHRYGGSYGGNYDYRVGGSYGGSRKPIGGYDSGLRRPGERWPNDEYQSANRRPRPGVDVDRRYSDYDDYRPNGNRRGDYSYHHSHHSQQNYDHSYHYKYHHEDISRDKIHDDKYYTGIHYLPATQYYPKSSTYYPKTHDSRYPEINSRYPVLDNVRNHNRPDSPFPGPEYLPPKDTYHSRPDNTYLPPNKESDYWGIDKYGGGGSYGTNGGYTDYRYQNRNRYDVDRRNEYLSPKPEIIKDWGLYGGSYGNGGSYSGTRRYSYENTQSYNYWGFDKYHENRYNQQQFENELSPPLRRNPSSGSYLPVLPERGGYIDPIKGSYFSSQNKIPIVHDLDNHLLPVEPRKPPTYNFNKDECSLRTATGFRLHKTVVKKFFSVPNIYECELLCFKEKDISCASFAFRYTVNLGGPTDNCYLSDRTYKELDYYTDLEPDKDFDIYTMNNRQRCEQPIILGNDNSDCFWRVRSGQRLDHTVVRDSLTTQSIVECQIECLRSRKFTCRAFSYRYGSPVIGGAIDNCQLTDWPFYELDPRIHFIPESGFEVYDRGSFGHGCEPDHFGIRGKQQKQDGPKIDQLCYIGFGTPARLLPQATKKALYTPTELDCKAECSKLRFGTLFQCMSFSYRNLGSSLTSNCFLSDILQRDLLPNVDYVPDKDFWLFAWDNYNPECIALASKPAQPLPEIENRAGYEYNHPLDTWRVYSVSGWPCRRGSYCSENREAGFWFCELEGGDKTSWDYCCRPDHQCGASQGYPYQWCYVGPAKTQWRKCSDRYYPYIHNIIDRLDHGVQHYLSYLPSTSETLVHHLDIPPSYRPGARPDRPSALPVEPPKKPSLDEYEQEFDQQFLSPPKPGGFGQPRHWPVSYLHKEMPLNAMNSSRSTNKQLLKMELKENDSNSKNSAIESLIKIIKNNDLKNVQYHIVNESNKQDDILYVKIPLPTNASEESIGKKHSRSSNEFFSNTSISLKPVYISGDQKIQQSARSQKSLALQERSDASQTYFSYPNSQQKPLYRRGFVTRTNITSSNTSIKRRRALPYFVK